MPVLIFFIKLLLIFPVSVTVIIRKCTDRKSQIVKNRLKLMARRKCRAIIASLFPAKIANTAINTSHVFHFCPVH